MAARLEEVWMEVLGKCEWRGGESVGMCGRQRACWAETRNAPNLKNKNRAASSGSP